MSITIDVALPIVPQIAVLEPPDEAVVVIPLAGPPGEQGEPGGPGEQGEPGPPGSEASITEHIEDPSPHPAYDEGPSLVLLYENAKV